VLKALFEKNQESVRRALDHLEYSWRKVSNYDLNRTDWSEEELEVLESFSSRFARCSDLVISRLLRSYALQSDPGFRGTLVDLLNLAEKQSWIDSAHTWYRIRELRNVAAYDDVAEDFGPVTRELFALCPQVLQARRLT
jgi:hypothetical protein